MRYLFLVLFFIANFASATRGQGWSWPIELNTTHGFVLKQKKDISNTPIVSIDNYTFSEDNSEDSEDSDDLENIYFANPASKRNYSKLFCFETTNHAPQQKVQKKCSPVIPIFLWDDCFLI